MAALLPPDADRGPRAKFGLLSPGDRAIERGDPFTTAFGIWGALTCRAGFVVESAEELPSGIGDYVERLVAPYFAAIVEWYATIRIGVTGGELHEIVARRLGDPFFGIFLNPGHQLHLDEWVNSPISPGSTIDLRSGMCFQVDVIPATGTAYFTTNIEDGIALADAALRGELAARHPGAWERIQPRRDYMRAQLGIELHADVLPLSNLPAHLPPFLLRPDRAMTVARDAGRARPRSDELEVVMLPKLGARIHRLRAFGIDLLRTPPTRAVHKRDPFFWGAYVMAPWCNRVAAHPFEVAGRTVDLAPNFPDGTAIHGQVYARPWLISPEGSMRIGGGGNGWPWAYEVTTGGGGARHVALVAVAADQPGR